MEQGDVSARLSQARREAGLSYRELARLTGYSSSVLQRYETGSVQKIPVQRLSVIAAALHVSPGWLIGGESSVERLAKRIAREFVRAGIIPKDGDLTEEQLRALTDALRDWKEKGEPG